MPGESSSVLAVLAAVMATTLSRGEMAAETLDALSDRCSLRCAIAAALVLLVSTPLVPLMYPGLRLGHLAGYIRGTAMAAMCSRRSRLVSSWMALKATRALGRGRNDVAPVES